MKRSILLFGALLASLCILGCGDDSGDTKWACECTGGRTTFVCAEGYNDAHTQALQQLCTGEDDCGCDCVDLLLEFEC